MVISQGHGCNLTAYALFRGRMSLRRHIDVLHYIINCLMASWPYGAEAAHLKQNNMRMGVYGAYGVLANNRRCNVGSAL